MTWGSESVCPIYYNTPKSQIPWPEGLSQSAPSITPPQNHRSHDLRAWVSLPHLLHHPKITDPITWGLESVCPIYYTTHSHRSHDLQGPVSVCPIYYTTPQSQIPWPEGLSQSAPYITPPHSHRSHDLRAWVSLPYLLHHPTLTDPMTWRL